MIKEIFYLVVDFRGYTDDCEGIILGMFERMGATIKHNDNGRHTIFSEDEEIINYVKFLAECDMINIVG